MILDVGSANELIGVPLVNNLSDMSNVSVVAERAADVLRTLGYDEHRIELAKIAGVNYQEYGFNMLKAGSSIEGLTIEDIIYQDFKNYKVGSSSLGISQIITMDFDVIKDSMDEIVKELNSISRRDESVVTLFVTDIVKVLMLFLTKDLEK